MAARARRADPGAHAGVRRVSCLAAGAHRRASAVALRSALPACGAPRHESCASCRLYSAPASCGRAVRCRPRRGSARAIRSALGGSLRAWVLGVTTGWCRTPSLVLGVAGAGAASGYGADHRVCGDCSPARFHGGGDMFGALQRENVEYEIGWNARSSPNTRRRQPRSSLSFTSARAMDS